MRIEQTCRVSSSPESVFDYLTDPANLRGWQTSKTRVEVVSEGRPRQGCRVREWTKPPGGREFEQAVEFAEFHRRVGNVSGSGVRTGMTVAMMSGDPAIPVPHILRDVVSKL